MSTQLSFEFAQLSRNMQSLAARLENGELPISRDISDLRGHVVSQLSRIDISLAAISKSLMVLHDRTELIARKVETIESLVSAQVMQMEVVPETPSPVILSSDSERDEPESEPLPMLTPVRGTSPDITCYETI